MFSVDTVVDSVAHARCSPEAGAKALAGDDSDFVRETEENDLRMAELSEDWAIELATLEWEKLTDGHPELQERATRQERSGLDEDRSIAS